MSEQPPLVIRALVYTAHALIVFAFIYALLELCGGL